MASPKSKIGTRSRTSRNARALAKATITTAFFVGPDPTLPKGAAGFKLKVTDNVSKVLTSKPSRVKALLQGYDDAIVKSRTAGRQVSFRVDVDPEGETVVTPVDDTALVQTVVVEDDDTHDPELSEALSAARARGKLKAAEILGGADMLNADDFARLLGISRVTVNAKRQSGQILGLDGAKRGFRFPEWQLDAEGKPYAALAPLQAKLGGPWAVYRFLIQPHGELNGLTGRQALEQGKIEAALDAAESLGRDFG